MVTRLNEHTFSDALIHGPTGGDMAWGGVDVIVYPIVSWLLLYGGQKCDKIK